MDLTEQNPLTPPQDDPGPSQPALSMKPESKLVRSLNNVSPFTYFFSAVLAISLVALAYFALQNLSLKSQLGMNSFKWPWTNATCTYQGVKFKPGESVPSVDGCNSCSCTETGEVACTQMACSPADNASETNDPKLEKSFKHSEFPFSFIYPSDWDYYITDNAKIHIDTKNHISNAKAYGCEDSKVPCTIWRTAVSITMSQQDKLITSDESLRIETIPFASGSIEGVRYETTYLVDIPGGGPKGTKEISIKIKHKENFIYIDLTDEKQINAFEEILSTFQFTEDQINENPHITFQGVLESMERPSPEINYDFLLELDSPYFDELDAMGPRNIDSIIVVPDNESIRQMLESNVGNSVSIEGGIEWGLAETRHLKAKKIVVKPDN